MITTGIAALIALAAITATYIFCIRPMVRGRGACAAMSGRSGQDAEVDRQLAELREELRVLRSQDTLDTGRVPMTTPQPPNQG